MTVTAAQLATLRRMCSLAVGDTVYTDAVLTTYIERYPLMDINGVDWFTWDYTTVPPTQVAYEYWIPTYDLNAAAADVWSEKAATVAGKFDFGADGSSYTLSQQYEQAQKQARYYGSRRSLRTIRQVVSPRPQGTYLVNGPDEVDL